MRRNIFFGMAAIVALTWGGPCAFAAEPTATGTTGAADPAVTGRRDIDERGLGLTAEQARILHQNIGGQEMPAASLGEGNMQIGKKVPDSLMLTELPPGVKDQIGSLRDFKFAKIKDDILLVNPTNRLVVDVVAKPRE